MNPEYYDLLTKRSVHLSLQDATPRRILDTLVAQLNQLEKTVAAGVCPDLPTLTMFSVHPIRADEALDWLADVSGCSWDVDDAGVISLTSDAPEIVTVSAAHLSALANEFL